VQTKQEMTKNTDAWMFNVHLSLRPVKLCGKRNPIINALVGSEHFILGEREFQ